MSDHKGAYSEIVDKRYQICENIKSYEWCCKFQSIVKHFELETIIHSLESQKLQTIIKSFEFNAVIQSFNGYERCRKFQGIAENFEFQTIVENFKSDKRSGKLETIVEELESDKLVGITKRFGRNPERCKLDRVTDCFQADDRGCEFDCVVKCFELQTILESLNGCERSSKLECIIECLEFESIVDGFDTNNRSRKFNSIVECLDFDSVIDGLETESRNGKFGSIVESFKSETIVEDFETDNRSGKLGGVAESPAGKNHRNGFFGFTAGIKRDERRNNLACLGSSTGCKRDGLESLSGNDRRNHFAGKPDNRDGLEGLVRDHGRDSSTRSYSCRNGSESGFDSEIVDSRNLGGDNTGFDSLVQGVGGNGKLAEVALTLGLLLVRYGFLSRCRLLLAEAVQVRLGICLRLRVHLLMVFGRSYLGVLGSRSFFGVRVNCGQRKEHAQAENERQQNHRKSRNMMFSFCHSNPP